LKTIVTILASSCLAVTLAACATANTPQQNLAYDRWTKCNAPYAQLERVDLDGRIRFLSSNPSTRQAVLQCLAEASQAGPPLPAPLAVRPAGNP